MAWDRSLSDYAFTSELHRSGWAWEFLRRNPRYVDQYHHRIEGDPYVVQLTPKIVSLVKHEHDQGAEAWDLLSWPDPTRDCLSQPVFWKTSQKSSTLLCSAEEVEWLEPDTLDLVRLNASIAILALEGLEFVTFSSANGPLNVINTGPSSLLHLVHVSFNIHGLGHLREQCQSLETLRLITEAVDARRSRNPQVISKFRDYLIALDGHLSGHSYREIACVIYGAERIGAYWRDDSFGIKSKVRRAVAAGVHLMNGGYRDLI